jgi:hypothetical protein
MPHKFNADRRAKIPKQKRRVTNCAEYDESLRRRGDLTVWISEDVLAVWSAPPRTTPGGQPVYSDLAIEMCLTLRIVFKQALRQTQGLMRSISNLMCVDITVPHFTTMSRRGNGLSLPPKTASKSAKSVQLVADSTGLKIFGEGEWLEEKHKTKGKRRAWRKLHLGLDLVSGQIVCSDLTTDDIGEPTVKALTDRFGAIIEVTIPPPKNAILSPDAAQNPSIRDRHIAEIEAHGRMAWQKSSSYNQRSRIETQIGRWKVVIGHKLKARTFENQKTEAKIGVRILNRMTELGRPNFERTA